MCYRCLEQFEIKISGSGTAEEIATALRNVADAVFHPTSVGEGKNLYIDDVEWEDKTLMTEIKSIES